MDNKKELSQIVWWKYRRNCIHKGLVSFGFDFSRVDWSWKCWTFCFFGVFLLLLLIQLVLQLAGSFYNHTWTSFCGLGWILRPLSEWNHLMPSYWAFQNNPWSHHQSLQIFWILKWYSVDRRDCQCVKTFHRIWDWTRSTHSCPQFQTKI